MQQTNAQQGQQQADAAHAISAAVAQMGLVLRESQDPVGQLGTLLAKLSQSVSELSSVSLVAVTREPGTGAPVGELLEQLQSDVFKGIQQLQFYDRMVQHMSHLQDYLIAVADEIVNAAPGANTRDAWEQIHAKLRARLISDEQRGLLDLLLRPDVPSRVSAQAARPDFSPPGDFEMF